MNYIQLIQRLKRESGRSGTVPASVAVLAGDDLNLGAWVADAWRDVQRRRADWAWMRKTVIGPLPNASGAYAATDIDPLATDLARWQDSTRWYAVRCFATATPGQVWDLLWLPYEQFQALFMVAQPAPGAPQYWSVAPDNRLLLGPAPTLATYSVRADYWARPSELALDADTPGMPAQFHMLLVWRALLEVAGFDAAPEVEVRAKRNLRMAWSDLLDDQAPRMQLTDEPLA